MKRLLCAISAVVAAAAVTAQVLPSAGVASTVWSGFGGPLGSTSSRYYGVLNTLQARADAGIFTLDGMINWGAVAGWNSDNTLTDFTFENTESSPLSFHYADVGTGSGIYTPGSSDYSNSVENTKQDSYYVNFLVHPFKGIDAGIGTKLNWQVGAAPSFGSGVWESDAHIRQGGFSTSYDDRSGASGEYQFHTDVPGSYDVVGFVPYANIYAKTAVGLRYRYEDLFEVGAAVPNGADTDSPVMNIGFRIHPVQLFSAAFSYEGLFQKYGNLYAGTSINFAKTCVLDAYFAWDAINNNSEKAMANGSGAVLTIGIPGADLTLCPEVGFNWFENSDYTPSFYAGGSFTWNVTEKIILGTWSSGAWGSADKNWTDKNNTSYQTTKDWTGGFIYNVRPVLTFLLNGQHALSADFDYENRTAFDGCNRSCWSAGLYWSYKYNTGSKDGSGKNR